MKKVLSITVLLIFGGFLMGISGQRSFYDFTVKNIDGYNYPLSQLKGKKVMIVNTASRCGYTPQYKDLEELYQKYKDKGFTILGVSLDRNKQRWLQAIADDKLNWTQVSDLKYWDNEVSDLYGVSSIPSNFLLDPKGIIIAKDLRGDDLNEKLEEIFKE
jgi:peroxiredoxin